MTIQGIANYIRGGVSQAADSAWNLVYGQNMERYRTICTIADRHFCPHKASAIAVLASGIVAYIDIGKIMKEREITSTDAIFPVFLISCTGIIAFALFTGIQQAAREGLQLVNGAQPAGNFGLQHRVEETTVCSPHPHRT